MKKLLKEKNLMWLAIAALAFCTIKPLVTKSDDMKRRGARMERFERSHERGHQMRGKEQTGRKERSTQKKKSRYSVPGTHKNTP